MRDARYLETALEAARAAGDVIRYYYDRKPVVRRKPDNSPVTDADLEAEKVIRETLLGAWPEHGFWGEEGGNAKSDAEWLWLVDPLDGTKGFVRGYPFVSTQIALMHAGLIELGVSNAPLFGELAWAERGGGSWLNGEPCAVSAVESLRHSTLSSGNLRSLARSSGWSRYGRLVAAVDRIRGYGDFYHYHLLATGRIDVVIESDVHLLDIAAVSLIIEEAGGRFTDLAGAPLGFQTSSVLATNGCLHDEVLQTLGSGNSL